MQTKDIIQFFSDNSEGMNQKFDIKGIEDSVKTVKFNTVRVGDVIVSAGLSANGGTITVRKIQEIDERSSWGKYGDRLGFIHSELNILIESPKYKSKHIEPYNRQGVFYLPEKLSQMELHEIAGWRVSTSTYKQSNLNMEIRDFYHNDFWNTVEFSVITSYSMARALIDTIADYLDFPRDIKFLMMNKLAHV